MAESVIQIKSGIMINVRASVKNINVKKIIFRILIHVLAKMIIFSKHYSQFRDYVWWNYRCRRNKNYSKNIVSEIKSLHFTCLFINYYSIIDSFQYLLLPDYIKQNKSIYCHIMSQMAN